MEKISNSKKYPEAWEVFVTCVRKWKAKDLNKFPSSWKYGIPNPSNPDNYLYSDCPGKLFHEFKSLFYKNSELGKFRKFLWWLEMQEGKINPSVYEYKTSL